MSRMAKFRLVLLAIVMILVGSLMMKAWLS
jgi:hypothetical protein